MAKTNVKRKEKEEESQVMHGGEPVKFNDINTTNPSDDDKIRFNAAVDNFNAHVNTGADSLKKAIDAYDSFINKTTEAKLKTAAITAINNAAINSDVIGYTSILDVATVTPKDIYDKLKIVYDGYITIYTAAKNKHGEFTKKQ